MRSTWGGDSSWREKGHVACEIQASAHMAGLGRIIYSSVWFGVEEYSPMVNGWVGGLGEWGRRSGGGWAGTLLIEPAAQQQHGGTRNYYYKMFCGERSGCDSRGLPFHSTAGCVMQLLGVRTYVRSKLGIDCVLCTAIFSISSSSAVRSVPLRRFVRSLCFVFFCCFSFVPPPKSSSKWQLGVCHVSLRYDIPVRAIGFCRLSHVILGMTTQTPPYVVHRAQVDN